MEIREHETDGKRVFEVEGELELVTATDLREPLLAAIERGERCRVELGDCSFIDSTGLRVLVEAGRLTARGGDRLEVAGANSDVRRVFEITMLHRAEFFVFE